jgi:hypothetical protein
MTPVPLHATIEQTNMILRGGKKKKHMKNSKKNIVQGAPAISLYPVKQFRKGEESKEEGFINSMKNSNGYDKHKKNKVYNERTMSQVLHGNFDKFIKNEMTPSDFNDKLDRYYTSLSNDDLETLKNDYAKFYNDKLEESRVKYKAIRANHDKKKAVKARRIGKYEDRQKTITRLEDKIYKDLEMDKKMTHGKIQKRIDIIYNILLKSGYTSPHNYIYSSNAKELVF